MDEIEVKFPGPCDEKWEAMTPSGCHRHCASCDTVIHDLEHMTGEEVLALLASDEEVCVRARISPGGTVELADGDQMGAPKLRTAAVGAAAGLALAACSTTPIGTVTPRYTVSGNLDGYWGETQVRLVGEGTEKIRTVRTNGEYRFSNLKAGSYRLHVEGYCIDDKFVDISLAEDDIAIAPISPKGEEWGGCIIVGKMEPVDQPDRA